jgi:aldose 1-epimerase
MTPTTNVIGSIYSTSLDGKNICFWQLRNQQNMVVTLSNFGARIVGIQLQQPTGAHVHVVPGFEDLAGYLAAAAHCHGATVGRYANRIAGAQFTIDGKHYQLPANNNGNTLHSGDNGWQNTVWQMQLLQENSISFHYFSPHGESGFPGNVSATVVYTLTEANELMMDYSATTDADTHINLTNHAYFNLNGVGKSDVLSHVLQVHAAAYVPVDAQAIPTGAIETVENTPFDFRQPVSIGSRINHQHRQLQFGNGYDHSFFLGQPNGELRLAAVATGDQTGITLSVHTTEPAIHLYTGNGMSSTHQFAGGAMDAPRTAFCLETQHLPNSPNQPAFPNTLLKAGAQYQSKTVYQFSTQNKLPS